MWNRILFYLAGFLKAKIIKGHHGEPYLERHLLWRIRGHAFFLHRFLASDPNGGLHDHPWGRSASLIVCGGYTEKRLVAKNGAIWMSLKKMSAGDLNVITGDDFHQVVLEQGCPAWTVFYHGPRVKTWGFAISEESSSSHPCEYVTDAYKEVVEDGLDHHWEDASPRARHLNGRMPADYCRSVGD